jgi:hypothetical protein
MPSIIPESRVVEIWRDQLLGRTDLVTEEGESVKIVYPGRLNDDRGADLRDAVIATGGGLIKGDIEIHVKSSNWWAHRHHQDPAYNRVILHVVFWRDIATTVILQNGQEVPTLALHKFVDRTDPCVLRPMPCRNTRHRWNTALIGEILDTAGEARFEAKTADFRGALSRAGAGQSLYEGIMKALGYAKNKQPMAELARRMPLHRLEAAAPVKTPDTECLARYQAMLMGTAGLLPSQRSGIYVVDTLGGEWVSRLERLWAASRETAPMSGDGWCFFKVRPGNFPTRRIAAMSCLLLRYRGEGLLAGLTGGLDGMPADTAHIRLERLLLVTAGGYWGRNLDFGLSGGMGLPALLGKARAADIVVNVLLPFAAAWGRLNSRPELSGRASEIYRSYPRLAENTLERHMLNQLGTGKHPVSSARRQQGLIHIYKNYCSQGRCDECPINREYD